MILGLLPRITTGSEETWETLVFHDLHIAGYSRRIPRDRS